MVNYAMELDGVFGALADATRRDILKRLTAGEMTVGAVAEPYNMSLVAVSKHLKVLERARLIIKRKRGKQQIINLSPAAFADAQSYIDFYTSYWGSRLETLDVYLSTNEENS